MMPTGSASSAHVIAVQKSTGTNAAPEQPEDATPTIVYD
jgi:hypothetical protein